MRVLLIMVAISLITTISVSAGPLIKVSAVQMRSAPELAKNVEKITQALALLSAEGVQIAVFPECALTSYDVDIIKKINKAGIDAALDSIASACKKHKISAIIGTPLHRPDGKLWNSAVAFNADGQIVERYHKVHLAEDWPEPGDHLALFDIAGAKATIIICHDERYPELVRLPVIAGARLVFYISSESGIRSETKLDPYRAQIQARAVENCVWVIHSNPPSNDDLSSSHGQSRIIKPDGNILKEASMFEEEVITAEIDLAKANGAWAQNSLSCDFLKAFWEEGLKAVNKK